MYKNDNYKINYYLNEYMKLINNPLLINNINENINLDVVKSISNLICDTITNKIINYKHEYYNYFKSIIDYNLKCLSTKIIISPLLFSDDMDFFKYKYEYDKYLYDDDKNKYNKNLMEILNEVNEYVFMCLVLSSKFNITYCVKCEKQLKKNSWNNHLNTKQHLRNALT